MPWSGPAPIGTTRCTGLDSEDGYSVRRDQTSEQDGAQRITPIFDQRKVQAEVAAQVAITQAFGLNRTGFRGGLLA